MNAALNLTRVAVLWRKTARFAFWFRKIGEFEGTRELLSPDGARTSDFRPYYLTAGADLQDKQFLLRICFPAANPVKK